MALAEAVLPGSVSSDPHIFGSRIDPSSEPDAGLRPSGESVAGLAPWMAGSPGPDSLI